MDDEHIYMRTTPAQVRAEIKRRGLPYDIWKNAQCWYVTGGDSSGWYSQSLGTYTFYGKPAKYWVDEIEYISKK